MYTKHQQQYNVYKQTPLAVQCMSDMLQHSEGFGRTTVLLTYKGNSECINRTVKRINGNDDW